ncbi:acyl-CoA N-acyltransferase [Diaporthe amygdali]|uniref:acyl-CoA N-acyltransferase n=1 Tax=Phomopsis amygdali TaxID=1214568 RepID=UPI0022FE205A|nr:acyl-CoA N-acyltransferase [Diaporthe amygdali]KAJ0119219.1 acyl-CoA N-acyltransferase [Diaporthe amygdali]
MLAVRPVEHTDVTECVKIRIDSLGSLVIGRLPEYPGFAENQEATIHRDIDDSPHIHHLKVVDPENELEIIAYAKWEVYKNGRPDLWKLSQPMEESAKAVDGFGPLREVAHNYFCTRNGEKGKHPHLLLALLVTARQHRQRGAGSILVRWGIELSDKTGLPCYVQASEQGRRLYQQHGFEEIDTVEFNLSEYGLEGIEKMTEMTRTPSAKIAPEHGDGELPG